MARVLFVINPVPFTALSPRRLRTASAAIVLSLIAALLAGCAGSPGRTTHHHLAAGLAGTGTLPAAASAWPEAGYDARHSSATPAIGPQAGTVKWKRTLPGDATPGPVIGADGSVLAATNSGVLYALNPTNGRDRWTFSGGGAYGSDLSTSPAVLAGGTILWPGPNDTLFALSQSGKLLWKITQSSQILSPAVAGAQRVYLATLGGDVTALEVTPTTHRLVWTLKLGGSDYSSPTIGPDGEIYTSSNKDLVAVRDLGASGKTSWRFHAKQTIEVSNPVTGSGTVVLGTNGDREYGISSTGSIRWSFDVGDFTYSSAVARPDGRAWFGDNSGRLWTVDTTNGTARSPIAPIGKGNEKIWTSPVVDSHDDAYWATTVGNIYGYDRSGHRLFAVSTHSVIDSYPALGADGVLYVASTSGDLYAIGG